MRAIKMPCIPQKIYGWMIFIQSFPMFAHTCLGIGKETTERSSMSAVRRLETTHIFWNCFKSAQKSVGRAVLCHPNLKPFLLVSLTKGPHTHQGVVCDPTTKDEFYTIAAARLTLAPHNSNSWSHDLRQQVHKRCCFRVTIYFFPTVGGTIRGVMQKPNVEASKIPHTERKTR